MSKGPPRERRSFLSTVVNMGVLCSGIYMPKRDMASSYALYFLILARGGVENGRKIW